ncbi:MAG: pirin family protein [Myxococcales bacterium]
MIEVLAAGDRFHTDIGWLNSRHTFSFGEHYDPNRAGFHALRVINDDRVAPGKGFGTHGHRDMEIISYVLEGELSHKDTMGTSSVIRPGEVQRMSAGKGVLHSEENPSREKPVHFLQIWIIPEKAGIEPSYEQKAFPASERRGKLRLVASRDGREGSVTVHQDAALYTALLENGERVTYEPRPGRSTWVHVARGEIELNGKRLAEGDGAAVNDEKRLDLSAKGSAEVLVFDLK